MRAGLILILTAGSSLIPFGHFITSVRAGYAIAQQPVLKYFLKSAIIGHEMIGDQSYGGNGALENMNNYIQMADGLRPLAHLLYSLNNDVADTMIMNMTPRINPLSGNNWGDHTGNSLTDLDLTRAGVSFAEFLYANPQMPHDEVALYLSEIICQSRGCHP